jgi:phosphoglycolate phosphatase
MNKKYLLFDLDGTLTDPKIGITSCVQYALESFGIKEENLDNLECYIGPPLIESFQNFHGLDEKKAALAVEKYRERFRDIGIFENAVIEGIEPVLQNLSDSGFILALATSKPQEFALRIMEHYNLAKYFTVQVGSGMNGERKYKADVINAVTDELVNLYESGKLPEKNAEILRNCSSREEIIAQIKADSIMIGDRLHDIEGAKQCQIESIGVRFGYAKQGELEEAGADYIVATPEELLELIKRL